MGHALNLIFDRPRMIGWDRALAWLAAWTIHAASGRADGREMVAHPGRAAPADLAAFQNALLPQFDAAYNFARFLSRDADAAQDIVQEAMLRAYRGFGGYRGGDPRAWIFSIVRNCFLDWQQERQRRGRYEASSADDESDGTLGNVASEEDTPEEALARKGEVNAVRDAIARLDMPMREVLVLRELEELSYREIAEVTGLPIGTVMSRLSRARDAFAAAWANRGGRR